MKPKHQKKSVFSFLLYRYARPFWKHILGLIFITLIANCFTTLQPVIMSGVVDVIIESKAKDTEVINESDIQEVSSPSIFNLNNIGKKVRGFIPQVTQANEKSLWKTLQIMLMCFVLTVFIASSLHYLGLITTRWIRAKATLLIRKDILKHLLSLNLGFFHKQRSGELISRIVIDAQNTGHGLGPLIRAFIHNGILIIIYSIYLFSTSAWMTLGAIGMIFLQFGLTQVIKKPVRRVTKNMVDCTAGFTTTLQETFTSIRVIKSFGAEKYEMNKLGDGLDLVKTAKIKEGYVRNFEPSAREFLDSFAFIGIFMIAAFQLIRNSLSVQGFLLFIYVGKLLITPINKFAVALTWTQIVRASYERLSELFSEKPKVVDGHVRKIDFQKDLVLENVSFSYDDDIVIDDISLTLNKGQVLALVGTSGAGKSTLTDLVLRFYDPQKGNILMDGVNLRDVKTSEYKKVFGVVPQESLLFNDTIKENIRYGRDDISDKDIFEAAKIANAYDFIKELPNGYDTFVGDRGVRLSGGQRQRIAIARAIVAKPQILIFDEATSSLDTESERQVQKAIDRVLEHSTAIVIAHRLSTVLHADKIAVLDKGKIESIGMHKELLEESPIYRRLYELQFKPEKESSVNIVQENFELEKDLNLDSALES